MCFVKAEPRNKPKIMDHCRSRTAETFDFVTEEVVTNLCALQSLEGGTFDALLDQAEAVRAIWFSEHPQKEPLPQCVAGKILCTYLIEFITCYVCFDFYFWKCLTTLNFVAHNYSTVSFYLDRLYFCRDHKSKIVYRKSWNHKTKEVLKAKRHKFYDLCEFVRWGQFRQDVTLGSRPARSDHSCCQGICGKFLLINQYVFPFYLK